MGLFGIGRRKEEKRSFEEMLLRAKLGGGEMTRERAMQIPAVSACVSLIANTAASVPIRLYKKDDNGAPTEVKDERVRLLSDGTGDLLTAFQMKSAMIRDYLLDGAGYSYIRKKRNDVTGLYYVPCDEVSVMYNTDPILKSAQLQVSGRTYRTFDFITIARMSEKGLTGCGVVEENREMLDAAYHTMLYELNMVKTGGNKKGFLLAEHKVDRETMQLLKDAWNKMYSLSSENVMVLNNGITFKEASNTVAEMQLHENKRGNLEQICNIFHVPPTLLLGGAGEEDRISFASDAVLPVLDDFAASLNRDLRLEKEKGEYFFAFDTRQLLRGDIEKLYRSYKTAIDGNFMTVDDVRRELNQPPLDFNYFKLGLQDVLYDPKTKEVYTPNTNAMTSLNGKKGDEKENLD